LLASILATLDTIDAIAMGVVVYLIVLVFLGLAVGALARLALPGPDPMSILQTVALGLAGNLVAGLIVWAIWGAGAPGVAVAVLCSMAILWIIRRTRGGGLTRPPAPSD
jgi:uncharacterized membrane protein YeaQ/YmgE (transglycosylase-associated protein family)